MKRTLGVCYYPEHWPQEIWQDDAQRMSECGLSHVRIGEFAWSRIEPEPGQFRFGWLDHAVETLADSGLKIVLGTPTATPPRWMLERYPDMLAIDEEGRQRGFGSRRHYDFSHDGYREECVRIAGLLAARYGHHRALAAWQTDNEYGCHGTVVSYSPAALEAFRTWLARRYGDVGRLNEAWGNVFWSMDYRDFGEIGLPNLAVTEANPSHRLDFARFSSDQVIAFDRAQRDAIRENSGAPVGHNMMGRSLDFDHFALGEDLEIATWDSYPLGFHQEETEDDPEHGLAFARQGDPDFQAFHHDLYRAVGDGRWWVMEQQPGPVNWAPYNPAPSPGMERLWAWEAFAHGAEVVSYFRWRQAPFAQEQMHSGLLRPDGSKDEAYRAAARIAGEIDGLAGAGAARGEIALVFDYESAWAWAIQPHGRDFRYLSLVLDAYRALRGMGLDVDVVPAATSGLAPYKAVLIPGLFTFREPLIAALRTFGGPSLIGPRAGSKTVDFHVPTDLPPNLPRDLLDLRILRVESLRPGLQVAAGEGAFARWREFAETGAGADIALTTDDGHPALIAQGPIRYLCGWPDARLWRTLLRRLAADAGLQPLDLPAGLRCRRDASGVRFWFNYGLEERDVRAFGARGDLALDGPVLRTGGVAAER